MARGTWQTIGVVATGIGVTIAALILSSRRRAQAAVLPAAHPVSSRRRAQAAVLPAVHPVPSPEAPAREEYTLLTTYAAPARGSDGTIVYDRTHVGGPQLLYIPPGTQGTSPYGAAKWIHSWPDGRQIEISADEAKEHMRILARADQRYRAEWDRVWGGIP